MSTLFADLRRSIPEDWSLNRIDEVASVSSGTTPARSQQERYFDAGSMPWVKTGDLNNGQIINTDEKITDVAVRECSVHLYPPKTVLIAMYGGFKQIGRTGQLVKKSGLNQALSALQVNNGDIQDWLNAKINLWRRFAASSRKDPNITGSDVSAFPIAYPPLPEQQKIAAILSTWDRAIELTEKLIAAKQKRKQALMQQLLTGKVRFAGFEKSKEVQQTPIGEMPADWTKVRLSQIFEKVKRKNAVGEQLVLTASGEFGLVDQREFFNRSVAGADLSKYYLLKRGEFAYNRSAMKGYPFGAIKRLDRYEQGVLSTLYGCFQLKGERCDSNYLCHFFEARLLDRQLRRITQVGGRAHGLLNIIDGDFYSMSLAIPSMDEQQRITAVLDAQEAENKGWRKTLDVLKLQKKGLMQQLLTGKVRVTANTDDGQGGPADE